MSASTSTPAIGNDTIDKATQAAHQTVDKVAAVASSAQESGSKLYANIEKSLRECTVNRPIQSLLWAVGAGIVIGRLFR